MGKKAPTRAARHRVRQCNDKQTRNLIDKGWRHDGLWWFSPYTQLRYSKKEAVHIEELRSWAEGDSAFLNDHNHSMWVKKEEDDNALTTMEEAAKKSQDAQAMRELAKDSCYY